MRVCVRSACVCASLCACACACARTRVRSAHVSVMQPPPAWCCGRRSMEYYRRRVMKPGRAGAVDPNDDVYVDRLRELLSAFPSVGVPPAPSPIYPGVFVGSTANAENLGLLRSLRISHVIDCSASQSALHRRRVAAAYRHSSVRQHVELWLDDDDDDADDASLLSALPRATGFIEAALRGGGRVLICSTGVSRSGAVAIAFLMRRAVPLMTAAQTLKVERRVALCNVAFMRQLVAWARARGALGDDVRVVRPATYGGSFDRYRILSTSMPAGA